jgi:U3 small nucleolar RNA-associated protein 20
VAMFCLTLIISGQSVSQSLHSATTSIFSPLLSSYLSCTEPLEIYTVLRRALTAFIHHVKSADQFCTMADLLIDKLGESSKTVSDSGGEERFRRMLDVIIIPESVRQGSRLSGAFWLCRHDFHLDCSSSLTANHLSSLASTILSVPMTEFFESVLLKLATSLLVAGDMSLWMGPGRHIIARLWEVPELGMKLSGALADLGWGGWKMIALPGVLRMTPQLLEKHPRRAIGLLAELHREKKLGEVDWVWRQRLEAWVSSRLTNWLRSEDSVTFSLSSSP